MKRNIKLLIATALTAVTILPTLTSCEFSYCQHKLETIKGTPATCKEPGVKSYYKCEFCHQLFGYDRFGIYEIDAPEVDESKTHSLIYIPKALGLSDKLNRTEFVSHCTICEEEFEIDLDDIKRFSPGTQIASQANNKVTAVHVNEGNVIGTTYTFKAGTPANNKLIIWRDQDTKLPGTSGLYETSIPYLGGVSTDTMLMVRNESDNDISIKYCAEDSDARAYALGLDGADVIDVPAHTAVPMYLPIKLINTQVGCCHEIYTLNEVTDETKLTFWGAFLPGTYDGVVPLGGKFVYKLGERFTAQGLTLRANYSGYERKNKEIDVNKCDIPLRGKVLDTSNKTVEITYRGITTTLPLTVYNPKEFKSFTLTKKPSATYNVGDVIDYSEFGFTATYGENRTFASVPLTIEDVEHEQITAPLTAADNNKVLTFKYNGVTVNYTLKVAGGND